jgi:hypothetical protein
MKSLSAVLLVLAFSSIDVESSKMWRPWDSYVDGYLNGIPFVYCKQYGKCVRINRTRG